MSKSLVDSFIDAVGLGAAGCGIAKSMKEKKS